MKKGIGFTSTLLTASLILTPLAANTAFAKSAHSDSFAVRYQQNAQIEAGLLQTAEASTVTNSSIAAVSSAVTSINSQVSVVYATYQSLASARPSMIQLSQTTSQNDNAALKRLQDKLTDLAAQLRQVKLLEEKDKNGHDKRALEKAKALQHRIERQLQTVLHQLENLKTPTPKLKDNDWAARPYDGAMPVLEDAILRLQQSAIHYTKEWIHLEQLAQAASGTSTSASSTGSDSTGASSGTSSSSSSTGTGSTSGTGSGSSTTSSS